MLEKLVFYKPKSMYSSQNYRMLNKLQYFIHSFIHSKSGTRYHSIPRDGTRPLFSYNLFETENVDTIVPVLRTMMRLNVTALRWSHGIRRNSGEVSLQVLEEGFFLDNYIEKLLYKMFIIEVVAHLNNWSQQCELGSFSV